MKRRDFIKFCGAISVTFSNLRFIGINQNTIGNTIHSAPLSPLLCSNLVDDLDLGDHLVIAGRPNMGKTEVALNLLKELALDKMNGCAYFSLELSKECLLKRLQYLNTNISKEQLGTEELLDIDMKAPVKSSRKISQANIFIDDSISLTAEEIHRKIEKLQNSGKNIKYVFVDYLQLLSPENNDDRRQDRATDSLRRLKLLAQKQNVIVISLSQLNRNLNERPNHRPVLENIRGTKSHYNIDKAVLLYREDNYDLSFGSSQIEMIVDKNKNNNKSSYIAFLDKNNFKITHTKLV